MKEGLTSPPILILPYTKELFTMYCDASKMDLGGLLVQNGQVVSYASRPLKTHERNYPIHDLELETIFFMLKV